jgi:hypothetical protein
LLAVVVLEGEAAMKKALIYCRVSTDEQAESGYGLDVQLEDCQDYAARVYDSGRGPVLRHSVNVV